jgi:hypothetical protein
MTTCCESAHHGCGPEAAHHFTTARSWAVHTCHGFAVEITVVELPADLKPRFVLPNSVSIR